MTGTWEATKDVCNAVGLGGLVTRKHLIESVGNICPDPSLYGTKKLVDHHRCLLERAGYLGRLASDKSQGEYRLMNIIPDVLTVYKCRKEAYGGKSGSVIGYSVRPTGGSNHGYQGKGDY